MSDSNWSVEEQKFGYDLVAAFRCHQPQPISPADVDTIIKEWTDGADEPSFIWLLGLKDGRTAVADGRHDYSGWDCWGTLEVKVFPALKEAIEMGLDQNGRELLGLSLPEELIK